MKYNYPVVYTYKCLTQNGLIDGYIVVKAYLIRAQMTFDNLGGSTKIYSVVMPYSHSEAQNLNIEKYICHPRIRNDEVINTELVRHAFCSYEAAEHFVSGLNEDLRKSYMGLCSDPKIARCCSGYRRILLGFDDKLEFYKKFEEKLLELTSDMEVGLSESLIEQEETKIESTRHMIKKLDERK